MGKLGERGILCIGRGVLWELSFVLVSPQTSMVSTGCIKMQEMARIAVLDLASGGSRW